MKKPRIRPLLLAAALLAALGTIYATKAPAAGAPAEPAQAMVSARQQAGPVEVQTMPALAFNGNRITLQGRLVNTGRTTVAGAGFYVQTGDGDGGHKVLCPVSAHALSGAASVLFEAETELPPSADATVRAFVVSEGHEFIGEAVAFDSRPPLKAPAIEMAGGALLAAQETALRWQPVEGAACYGVILRDITAGGKLLLGQTSGGTAVPLWLGASTSVPPGLFRDALKSGHTYRIMVCAGYDEQTHFGSSVDFAIVTRARAASITPTVKTGPYAINEDGTITLYGSADGGGRPLASFGFLWEGTSGSLRRTPADDPEEHTGGAYSITVDAPAGHALHYRVYAVGANGTERLGALQKIDLVDPDPFAPVERTAQVDAGYVPLLEAFHTDWAFQYIKKLPYHSNNTAITLLYDWEDEHILRGFSFPGRDIAINAAAQAQYQATADRLNSTAVKVLYRDGSETRFQLSELVQTASCYNSRYIAPSVTDGAGKRLPPDRWNWRLSLHSWGLSVDINAIVPVNLQRGVNFGALREGAARLSLLPGPDEDGAVVLRYDGDPQQGRLVPDNVTNLILYELALKPAGFYWGAYFGNNRTDAMHFSLIEVPAKRDIPIRAAREWSNE